MGNAVGLASLSPMQVGHGIPLACLALPDVYSLSPSLRLRPNCRLILAINVCLSCIAKGNVQVTAISNSQRVLLLMMQLEKACRKVLVALGLEAHASLALVVTRRGHLYRSVLFTLSRRRRRVLHTCAK